MNSLSPFEDLSRGESASGGGANLLPDSPNVYRALEFATATLDGKTRGKHAEPAVLHSIRVAIILYNVFHVRSCKTIVTALLHDVLEGSETDYDEVAMAFGDEVADCVVLLTKPKFYPKPLRKQVYESAILSACEDVLLVKLADLYDNLQARRGRKRLRRTWRAASHLLDCIADRRIGSKLRRAVKVVQELLVELESEEPVLIGVCPLKIDPVSGSEERAAA